MNSALNESSKRGQSARSLRKPGELQNSQLSSVATLSFRAKNLNVDVRVGRWRFILLSELLERKNVLAAVIVGVEVCSRLSWSSRITVPRLVDTDVGVIN